MEKNEFRLLIKHYFLRKKPDRKPRPRSVNIIQKRFTVFRCGRTRTEIIPSPGRPNEITAPEIINKIHDIVLNDQKRICVTTSEQNFVYFNRNRRKFLRLFLTMNETWIHHHTPE